MWEMQYLFNHLLYNVAIYPFSGQKWKEKNFNSQKVRIFVGTIAKKSRNLNSLHFMIKASAYSLRLEVRLGESAQ